MKTAIFIGLLTSFISIIFFETMRSNSQECIQIFTSKKYTLTRHHGYRKYIYCPRCYREV